MPPIERTYLIDRCALVIDEDLKQLGTQTIEVDLVSIVSNGHDKLTFLVENLDLFVNGQTEELYIHGVVLSLVNISNVRSMI